MLIGSKTSYGFWAKFRFVKMVLLVIVVEIGLLGLKRCEISHRSQRSGLGLRKYSASLDPKEEMLTEIHVPICPECRDGKHTNCIGSALHPVTDDIVDCLCNECHKLK